MSFLFKSKKQDGLPKASRNLTSADGFKGEPRFNAPPPVGSAQNMGPNGRGLSSPGPDDRTGAARGDSAMGMHGSRPGAPPSRPGPGPGVGPGPPPDMSLYPWSQKQLAFTNMKQNPFPRYGAAVNALTSKDGDIYLMGGLIGGSMVKGDLWMIESGSPTLSCYPVPTTAEGPGPRVGHASLLVGNAFIVFGGDTKIDEMDVLDDTLYLLNTSTKHWSRALPSGPRPSGRYGHTLNIIASKIFVFGGQVEGYFFNDLVAFDLNNLQQPSNRWEVLIPNSNDGGPPQGVIPPARTNHTVVTHNDKLYLFGGTDGMRWYNDVWTYDPAQNAWTQQDCIGFIPAAREGHSAAIVGDVMYVFGGRTEEGKDLGDLAAFRIPTRRWYTFQNMGPSPSPRSGHGMTAHGEKILVLGGEPSSAPSDPNELSLAYILDTSKIRYPADNNSNANNSQTASRTGSRRPSTGEKDKSGTRDGATSRDGVVPNGVGKWQRSGSDDSASQIQPQILPANNEIPPPSIGAFQQRPMQNAKPTGRETPQGGPQMAPASQAGPNINGIKPPFGQPDGRESPSQGVRPAPGLDQSMYGPGYSAGPGGSGGPRQAPTMAMQGQYSPPRGIQQQPGVHPQGSLNNMAAAASQAPTLGPSGPNADPRRQFAGENVQHQVPGGFPVDSGVGSSPSLAHQNQTDLIRELESVKSKNAWYASELSLARKSGYRSSSQEEDTKSLNSIGEEEKPLIEALLKMRSELVSTQDSFRKQTESAAHQIAQVERQRDAAIAEVAYMRTRNAARGKDSMEGARGTPDSERTEDVHRRLATSLTAQNELSTRIQALNGELEAERKARQLAEESADVAHNRASELDVHKQHHTSELEQLRSQLHDIQKAHREESASRSEAQSRLKMLQLDKDDLTKQISANQSSSTNHATVLASLREAVNSSNSKTSLLEQHLTEERKQRGNLEDKLSRLRAEHEARVSELETTQRRLQEAEQLGASHAAEAKTHREVVLAGFGKTNDKAVADTSGKDERITALQQQVETANLLVRQNQEAADRASEDLRKAELRIAGLLSFQEQTNREGLRQRRELQLLSTNAVTHRSEMAQLQDQLKKVNVSHTALQVQHGSLKNLLSERGLDSNELATTAASNAPGAERLQELENQLESSMRAHADMRASFEQREAEANRGWESKLAALDNDYQAAVKYLKGTEKMLGKMKQELARYKTQNKDLEDELTRSRGGSASGPAPSTWESERASLHRKIEDLEATHASHASELQTHMEAARSAVADRDRAQANLSSANSQSRNEVEGLRKRNAQLEERVAEAEHKVQVLLDTVGTKVRDYRRESQQIQAAAAAQAQQHGTGHGTSLGHARGLSGASIAESDSSIAGPTGALEAEALSRNSMALDSLASELETLRNHWETTNKNYRLSAQSDIERTPTQTTAASDHTTSPGGPGLSEGLASWRRKLELDEQEGRP